MDPANSQEEEATGEDLKHLITETVMYLIAQEKSKQPARRHTIVKQVLQGRGRSFNKIMKEAKRIIQDVFGLEVCDADNKYFLVNKFPPSSDPALVLLCNTQEEASRNVLLMIVLTFIFMSGGTIKEADLWQHLKRMTIMAEEEETSHAYFGNVKRMILKDFVSMLYLEHNARPGTDPPVHEFSFGARALKEVSKRSLLEFSSKMCGDCPPSRWPLQLQEVLREEEGIAEASQASQATQATQATQAVIVSQNQSTTSQGVRVSSRLRKNN